MKYALLIYNASEPPHRTPDEQSRMMSGIVEVLERPTVNTWLQLPNAESATTVRYEQGRTLLTDGPFVESKDYLGGFIVIDVENLDEAIATAEELQRLSGSGAIEIRPVPDQALGGA